MYFQVYVLLAVVYPCVLLMSYNLCFTRQKRFFNHDVSKLFNLKLQSSLMLEGKCAQKPVNANKTRKVLPW